MNYITTDLELYTFPQQNKPVANEREKGVGEREGDGKKLGIQKLGEEEGKVKEEGKKQKREGGCGKVEGIEEVKTDSQERQEGGQRKEGERGEDEDAEQKREEEKRRRGKKQGDGGGDEAMQLQQQPAGRENYKYSPSVQNETVASKVQFTESYLADTKQHFDDIDKQYIEICQKREEIDILLNEFRVKLKCDSRADFPLCFLNLRKLVGDFTILEFTEDDPLRIVIDENAEVSAREAVKLFNSMLEKCLAFPDEAEAAKRNIQIKIEAAESGHQEAKVEKAQCHSKKMVEIISEFRNEMVQLVKDVRNRSARECLDLKPSTGMLSIRQDMKK